MADTAEVRPNIEVNKTVDKTIDKTSANVVSEMMSKTTSEVAKTIKQMEGNSGTNGYKLPSVEIVSGGEYPAKGNDAQGHGPSTRRTDADGAYRGERTQSPDERAEKK